MSNEYFHPLLGTHCSELADSPALTPQRLGRLISRLIVTTYVALLLCFSAPLLAAQAQTPPPVPAGATRVVTFDRQGARVAICAETGEDAIQQGGRRVPATAVWAGPPERLRRLTAGLGACDPSWSPDGRNLALTAQDGLWLVPAGELAGQRRVESRPPEGGLTEFSYRVFSGPRWSPDGRLIGVIVSNGGTSWVDVYDMFDGRLFYTSPPETYAFTWGPAPYELRMDRLTIQLPLSR
jgi:hypothetical protein